MFLDSISKNAIETVEVENGYTYRFSPAPDLLTSLANLVELERQCCPFLTFRIVVQPKQPIALEVTGPPETKSVIADYFGS